MSAVAMIRSARRPGLVMIAIGAILLGAGAVLAVATPNDDSTQSVAEDAVNAAISLTASTDNLAATDATATITTGPTNGTLQEVAPVAMTCASGACSGAVHYSPDANYNGSDSFTFNVDDGSGPSATDGTITITVNAVNDPPSFTKGADAEVNEDSGPQTVAGWATGMSAGPADEAGQTLDFVPTTDTASSLFAVEPAVDATTGDLTFTPAANANGSATIGFKLHDNGGGTDLSAEQTFTITITSVNDPPAGTNKTITVLEDGSYVFGTADFGFSDPLDSPPNALLALKVVTLPAAGSLTDNLVAVVAGATIPVADITGGKLAFRPAANANGSSYTSFTFRVQDDGGTASGGIDLDPSANTITANVTSVNDPPSFTKGSDVVVNESTGAFTATGWATNLSTGPADESSQALTFAVTDDDNASLFSVAPAVSASGTLTFTPAFGLTGTANITLQVRDDGGTANGGQDASAGQSFTIRVNAPPNAVNDTTFVVPENSPGQILDVLANDTSLPDPPETLTITSVTQPAHGSVVISDGGADVTYTPTPMYYGDQSDFFTYAISDGYDTDTATVILSITKDTTAPTVTAPIPRIRAVTTMGSTSLSGTVTWGGTDAGVGISKFQIQRSTSGGTYTTLTLASATSTSVNVTYTFGTKYRFRVRATDRNGNVSGWVYSGYVTPGRYQETSSAITYSGTWTRVFNSSDSGSYAKYTTVANRSATFKHTMRDVAFVAPTSSTRGSVYIYVDGTKVKTLSLKTSTVHYRRVMWTWHFAGTLASHTVKIVVVGNGRVDLDCFVILS